MNTSEQCANPICTKILPPGSRSDRRFCSDACRLDGWALARAAKLLLRRIEPTRWNQVLDLAAKSEDDTAASSPH